MDETLILHHFANQETARFCLEALQDFRTEPFSKDGFRNADLVITDQGISGMDFPGYVPVILLISDEDDYPDGYFTREADVLLTAGQLRDEVAYVQWQAGIGKELRLADYAILRADMLEDLVRLGGRDLIIKGLRDLIKNCTLQLNECMSLSGRQEYEDIRFILHALKGNSATLGAEQFSAAIAAFETDIQSEIYTKFEEKLKLLYTLLTSFNLVSNRWQQQ